jgi:hypothetical protein
VAKEEEGRFVSTSLVVLSESGTMPLCQICPKPGACCSNFKLHANRIRAWYAEDSWEEEAKADVYQYGISQFIPQIDCVDEGRVYVRYSCTKLGEDGRCTDYESRPQVCWSYAPRSCKLCVLPTVI